MPLKRSECPEWNFLKFKHYKTLGDGTIQGKPSKAERPWETNKIRILLDQITNPETFTADETEYKIMVSEEKATLAEVKELGNTLQKIIKDRKFPSRGIHNGRHLMYKALFDELIRQVVIEHPDLGDILIKIRNHFRQEIYNYEQVYAASQAYGYRKQFMEKNDERLIELEKEAEQLLNQQKQAIKLAKKAYKENIKLMKEYDAIDVDEDEYWRAVKFYQNYIKYLLYFFDLRAEEEKIIQDLEEKEEQKAEEEEEEEQTEVIESFSLGDDHLEEEEEEEPPGIPEEEVKVDTTKQQKEEPIDKDLIYRDNEEEVFDSDVDTEQTILSELPKSQDDVLPPIETDPAERLKTLVQEELKHEISYTDIARGFRKKAYEEELKMIEEQKRLEEEKRKQEEEQKKLALEKSKQKDSSLKKKKAKRAGTVVEADEEDLEEEGEEEEDLEEEGEQVQKERPSTFHEDASVGREGSFYRQGSEELKTEKEIPFLNKPKYAFLRRLNNSLKCKDFFQRLPKVEPIRKRKVKKVLVKKSKTKSKVETPVEKIPDIPPSPEAGTEEESLTAVRASEFKWGVPLLEYFAQIGRKTSTCALEMLEEDELDTQEKKEEEKVSVAKEEAVPEEESSELFSSGLTIGKTESFHSSQASEHESISIDEEEEEKEDKQKVDDLGEEEDNESVFLF